MLPYSKTPVLDLALAFTDELMATLSSQQQLEVRLLNAVEPDNRLCRSHDFCDANQVMIDALDVVGETFDAEDRAQGDWLDTAWALARLGGFMPNKIRDIAVTFGVDQ